MTDRWKRWVPAAVVPVVIAGVAIAIPVSATGSPNLPTKSPQDVIAMIGNSTVTAFSGTVAQTSNLGLPELPAGIGASDSGTGGASESGAAGDSGATDSASTASISSALELLTGTHSARVYVDGPSNQRVQVLDQLAESDVVRQGNDVWAYDSKKQTAVHTTLPADAGDSAPDAAYPESGTPQTPEQLAQKFLGAVDPTTNVSVGGDVTVAGRSAYDLVLAPQAADTLIGSVSIAVDSATGLPLQVSVTSRGSADPAFVSGFTDLSLDTPASDLFSFAPPAGTTVTEKAIPSHDSAAPDASRAPAGASNGPKPVVTGTGWDSIVEVPAGTDSAALTSSPLLGQLTTPVAGGHVLSTTLVTVLVTDDGRILAGSVSADKLQAAAAAQ